MKAPSAKGTAIIASMATNLLEAESVIVPSLGGGHDAMTKM